MSNNNTSGLFFVKYMNKQYRLKESFNIEKLVKKRLSVGNSYFVIYYNYSSVKTTRVAISVSKKLGNAVVRNKQKRIIREIVRRNLQTIVGLDILIVQKFKALDLNFEEKQIEIIKLFNKAIRKGM